MTNMNRSLAYFRGIIIPFARENEYSEASNLVFIHLKNIRW